jgi:transposase
MDVHKESYTMCCYTFESDKILYQQKIKSDYRVVLKFLEQVRKRFDSDIDYVCGYEAGFLGYALYHQLTQHGVKCIILAPTTMAITNNNRVKTDKKDAGIIARCLAFHTYSEVHVPTDEDNSVKEYIRMRDDQKKMLKSTKQQILVLVQKILMNKTIL